MKTKEELNALKEEVEALNRKLRELTEEELAQVTGGFESVGGGKYNFYNGETFIKNRGNLQFVVIGDHENVPTNGTVPVTRTNLSDGYSYDTVATAYYLVTEDKDG